MRSHEVLREAVEGVGVKALAAELRLSPALVYKWCQQASREDRDASGARNPLDRLADVVRVTSSRKVVEWLCHEADGFFVPNPKCPRKPHRVELLGETQKLVAEFGRLLLTVTRSIEDDGYIDGDEADRIRRAWERLKAVSEEFTVACERGLFSADHVDSDDNGG